MFYLKRVIAVIIVLFVVSLWFMVAMVSAETGAATSSRTAAQPLYSGRGPHLVGTRSVVIDEQLPLTLWYPAAPAAQSKAAVHYPYEVKLFEPLGAVKIATFAGEAIPEAAYAPTAEPYPLVILSPGFALGSNTYGWLAEHLASYGFVVVSPDHEEQLDPTLLWRSTVIRPQDVQMVFAFIDQAVQAGGMLEGVVDGQQVAVVGHSYGGYTALAAGGGRLHTAAFESLCQTAAETDDPILFLCEALLPNLAEMAELAGLDSVPEGLWPSWGDERVQAVVSLAGDAAVFEQAGLAEIQVPVLAMGGTADLDSPYPWSTQLAYEFAASPRKIEVGLVAAEHMVFTGRCETVRRVMKLVPTLFCHDPVWDKQEVHELVNHFTAAFLLAELKGDAQAAALLAPTEPDFSGVTYRAEGY